MGVLKDRYSAAVDKIVTNWTAVKPQLPDRYAKGADAFIKREYGKSLNPTRLENYKKRIEKVTSDFYKSRVEQGAEKFEQNWLKAMAV